MTVVSQIFGISAMISLFFTYQQNSRKNLLYAKLTADFLWSVHYLLLGGIAGMIPNVIGIFREAVFLNRYEKKWAAAIFWPVFFILVTWTVGIHTFSSVFNILPIFASSFVTLSLWLKNPVITKKIAIPVSAAFIIYDITVKSYVGILNEMISICSVVISLFKTRYERKSRL